MKLTRSIGAIAAVLLVSTPLAAQAVRVDENLPSYKPVQGVSGSIKSIGSDTMNNMMTLWAEGFMTIYPNVQVEIEGKGSSTAPPALTAGTANFGPMSREMKDKEQDDFEKQFGYKPMALRTSIDMLAVYVNKDNPLDGLTLQQVDAIFSKNRKGGYASDVRTWGDVGLEGPWASQPISIYGRNSASGTYGYFKKKALFKGDFKDSVKEQPGSSAVIQGIASDRFGMGYSGIGYKTADVKVLSLGKDDRATPVPATPDNAYAGKYPLSRFLFVYINHEPNTELDPLRREFVKYIFSREGQADVVKSGYLPITAKVAEKELARFGLSVKPVPASANG